MCSQYRVKTSAKTLRERLGAKFLAGLSEKAWDLRLQGYLKTDQAPVVVGEDQGLQLKVMHWSLCPHWSKAFPFKPSTYNARLERPKKNAPDQQECIYQVPSFRDAFNKGQTCLVPMNYAVESSYFGSHAGEVIRVSDSEEELFMAAGIYSEWVDQKTGEVKDTFTLLTDTPDTQMFEFGHDRSILRLADEHHIDWLTKKEWTGPERLKWLRAHRIKPKWQAETDRKLKDGWQKRAPTEEKLESMRKKVWQGSS